MGRPKKEIHSDSFEVPQRSAIEMPPINESIERTPDIIVVQEEVSKKKYADDLAFAEEPVCIRISPQAGDYAPKVIDCWVNGKGAEMYQNGKWIEYGAFPVGVTLVTKRKYVEVLARSKKDSVKTRVVEHPGEDPVNKVEFFTSLVASFSIIEDRNPKGREWARQLLSHV